MKKEIIKPFNFEKAKSGAKLRTRNGCPVEIFKWNSNSPFPIKGIISKRLEDIASEWNIYGIWCGSSNGDLDLVIVEEVAEPKFKVGDWIVRDGRTLLISCIEKVIDGSFYYWFATGTWVSSTKMEEAHLWTIKDAKAGDVLVTTDGSIFILTSVVDCAYKHYVALTTDGVIDINEGLKHYWETSNVHPATKEQRELLFTKMKEAGYEWDANHKQLKKIEQKKVIHKELTEFEKAVKQVMEEAIECGDTRNLKADAEMLLSLVHKSAWSEEDEKMLSDIIKDLVHPWNEYIPDRIEDEIKWLKNKLKPLRPQKQDVMSEDEFRHIVGYLVQDIVANEHMAETEKQPTKFFVEKYYKKLRHQNTWKPSDEQIKAVKEAACYSSVFSEKTIDNLISLSKQLKKLREEQL